jgi:three-Cys-motif partner protein
MKNMPGINTTTWEMDPHTKAKHEILENYLKAWFPILSRYNGRIVYLDGFAGPGIYSGGEEGSPLIALRTFCEHTLREQMQCNCRFLFIESNPERVSSLTAVLTERFPNLPDNCRYNVIGAEFAPTLEETLNGLERQGVRLAPTFAFVDPFGF